MEGHAVSFDIVSRDAQTLNLSRNVSNFYAGQVVSLINGQLSQNVLPKVDLLSTIRNKFPQQRVDRERWRTRNISYVESFCIEYIIAAFKAAICEIRVFVSRISLALEQPNIFIFFCSVRWVNC